MNNRLKTFLRVIFILAAFSVLLWFFQNRLIFFPAPWPTGFKLPDAISNASLSQHTVTAEDGVNLSLVLATPINSEKNGKIILFNHGNAGNLLNRMDKVNHFCQMGYSVLVYDYRGFGLSSGTPDVEGAKKDADAALIFLKQTFNYANSEIVIYGESLGTGLAAELVRKADHPFAGLVLESGFASLKTQANRRFPGIGTLILKADLPTLTTISAYKGPLLIIHSRKDEVIPFSDSETLYNASPSAQKFFLALESGGHNDPVWNDPKYEEAWNFLKSCWKQEIEGQ